MELTLLAAFWGGGGEFGLVTSLCLDVTVHYLGRISTAQTIV